MRPIWGYARGQVSTGFHDEQVPVTLSRARRSSLPGSIGRSSYPGLHRRPELPNRTPRLPKNGLLVRLIIFQTEPPRSHTLSAFFEESFEHRIGLVQRGRFESKMQFPPPAASSDLGWYALRNIVYAIGSRLVLAEDTLPSSYGVARDTSWAYFENALSVHVELLYMRTDSSAVEALLLMVTVAQFAP